MDTKLKFPIEGRRYAHFATGDTYDVLAIAKDITPSSPGAAYPTVIFKDASGEIRVKALDQWHPKVMIECQRVERSKDELFDRMEELAGLIKLMLQTREPDLPAWNELLVGRLVEMVNYSYGFGCPRV